MSKPMFYLEAPSVTQDLLTVKWSLRAAGYAIGSTWHDTDLNTGLPRQDHWSTRRVEQLQACEALVVLSGKAEDAARELGLMAGIALARGLRVIWLGPPVPMLSAFRAVELFQTAEDFRKHLVHQQYSPALSLTDESLAA
jgi:hypothetical protein